MEGILTFVENFIQVKEIVEGLQLKGEEKEVQEAKKEAADQLPPPSASSASRDTVSGSSRVGDPSPPASTVSSPPDTNLPVPATAAGSATSAAAPSITSAASTSQPAPRIGAQPSASAPRPRRTRAAQARPNQESVGPQVRFFQNAYYRVFFITG